MNPLFTKVMRHPERSRFLGRAKDLARILTAAFHGPEARSRKPEAEK